MTTNKPGKEVLGAKLPKKVLNVLMEARHLIQESNPVGKSDKANKLFWEITTILQKNGCFKD